MRKGVHFNQNTLGELPREERRTLINRLTGSRLAWLMGTQNEDGQPNLALFSQVLHISAAPARLGILFRPEGAERHSLHNLHATRLLSLNALPTGFVEPMHCTSANFPKTVSEFEACGWKAFYRQQVAVPLIEEAWIQIVLEPEEQIAIKSSGGLLLVAKVLDLWIDERALDAGRHPQPDGLQHVCGLDLYTRSESIQVMPHARV